MTFFLIQLKNRAYCRTILDFADKKDTRGHYCVKLYDSATTDAIFLLNLT